MTGKPHVFIARRIPEEAIHIIGQHCDYTMWREESVAVPGDVFLESVRDVDGILTMLTDKVTHETFQAAPNIKVVANMAVGYDNIDLEAARQHGVTVTNTPDVLTETTADLTFGLLLAAARRIVESANFVKDGKWVSWSPMLLSGMDVFGKKLGIIGMGRIGEALVRRALGFNMTVQYFSRTPKNFEEQSVSYVPLDELLQSSDFVCILAPLTSETHHLIGERELSMMKSTAVLVNTARGPIVDETALYHALVGKKIWAAALDVFAEEPMTSAHPLLRLPNVIATPHIGSSSVETRTQMAVLAARNLVEVLMGRPAISQVV